MGKKKKHQKSKFRIYLEFIPFYGLYQLIRLLPLRVAYAIAAGLFRGLYRADSKHRNRTIQHLLHAGVAKDRAEAERIAHGCYRQFSRLLVEIVKMDQCFRLEKTRSVGSADAIAQALNPDRPNRNVIIVTAHYGNWEVAGSAFSLTARIPMVSIMRAFANPLIGDMILKHRASGVHELVPKETGLRHLLRALRDGKNVSILIDQHAAGSEGVETTFFGHPCRTHMTPALLHLKTGIPILPELTRRVSDDFEFEFVVGDLIQYTPTGDKERDIQAVTQLCTDALEKLIAEQPDQWLWTARRWLDINRGPYPRPKPATTTADEAPATPERKE